jgi:hypothetical protein
MVGDFSRAPIFYPNRSHKLYSCGFTSGTFAAYSLTLPLLSLPNCPAAVLHLTVHLKYVVCTYQILANEKCPPLVAAQHEHSFYIEYHFTVLPCVFKVNGNEMEGLTLEHKT